MKSSALLISGALLAAMCVAGALAPTATSNSDGIAPEDVRALLAAKYPSESVAFWCGGAFLGNPGGGAAELYDGRRGTYRVVWLSHHRVRELHIVPAFEAGNRFELQCLDAKEAAERKQTLRHSESIRDFLHLPTGRGALCYFVDETETKCWSMDRKGDLVDIGGWQT